jgi:hypothetical protein
MSDLLQTADAICCICDLVSHTELLPFTHSMQYGVAIWCCDMVLQFTVRLAVRFGARFLVVKEHGIAHQIADTLNRICDLVHTQNRICDLEQKKDRK